MKIMDVAREQPADDFRVKLPNQTSAGATGQCTYASMAVLVFRSLPRPCRSQTGPRRAAHSVVSQAPMVRLRKTALRSQKLRGR
jgi:hypothetical protein